ncbi:branched-chain amino acid aminotransferase [Pseudomonas sp. KU26590]|uniref:branched-chain amino acid aminotransferase n=1 Tax=Pseudomonas sp. KU26590 TaxID=2991051 RepID=UPI00223DE072|nr:branched-chain amino acid aminotransferase [Pseudomonas sp. KU26590]UZJ62758.1 branched-chain amino acid aminotransferase [Pseudomonas sp. KU26590]
MQGVEINWDKLGFDYIKTAFRYRMLWREGEWQKGALTADNQVHLSEGSTALHYGQQCFEGLKAYRTQAGIDHIFRPLENARRMARSCRRLLMPEVPEDLFVEACRQVVLANKKFMPPYSSGGALYLRPYVIGVGDNVGIRSAPEFLFSVFCVPVGSYFKGGLKPHDFLVTDYDRVAAAGTGSVKIGGNYAAGLLPAAEARGRGFADCIYLDPDTHSNIEEVGAANFFGISQDRRKFITPSSSSILPGITLDSLITIAAQRLGLQVEQRHIRIDELNQLSEAGACGTAAVITPIRSIEHRGAIHAFDAGDEVGPVTLRLYQELTGIQKGDVSPFPNWLVDT